MKKILIGLAALCMTVTVTAQEFKVAKSSGKLQINLGRVTVEGHTGNEIIFSSKDHDKEEDERAKGLKAINGSGLDDNTGLGINVTEKDGVLVVSQLKKMNSPDIKILVPKGVIVAYEHSSQYGNEVVFRNLENEIEVSANYNSVELENITGPATIKAVYGGVDAVFSATVKGPISIVSIYGHVDVAMPTTIKANIKMSTSYGEIFVAPDFKIEMEKAGEMINYSDKLTGKINGGGMNIDFRSDYGKIYFRKK
jgi:predicted membrane protein